MSKKIITNIYSPESKLRSPLNLFKSMYTDLLSSRELAWRLIIRDITAKYRQSLLGIAWAFLPPIALGCVFVLLNKANIINPGQTTVSYPAYVLFGTIIWQLFADSVNAPLKSITTSKGMLAKINFPYEALIVSALGQILFDFAIRLVILIIVFLIFKIPLTVGFLLSLLAILMLIFLGLMLGMFLTPLGILYNDVASALSVFMGLWFFVTPVAYTVPNKWPYSLLIKINPVTPFLVNAQELAFHGKFSDPLYFFIFSFGTILGLFIMWIYYKISFPIVIERMGA